MSTNELLYGILFVGLFLYACMIMVSFVKRVGPLTEHKRRLDETVDRLQDQIKRYQEEWEQKKPELAPLIEKLVELRETRDRLQAQDNSRTKSEEEDALSLDPRSSKRVDR